MVTIGLVKQGLSTTSGHILFRASRSAIAVRLHSTMSECEGRMQVVLLNSSIQLLGTCCLLKEATYPPTASCTRSARPS